MEYIIIKNVTERTAPNTKSYGATIHTEGNTINFSGTIRDNNGDLWGIVENKERAFVAINVKGTTYCKTAIEIPDMDINELIARIEKLEAWVRSFG